MKYRFFYSPKQNGNECCPLVKTPDGVKEYSEMRSDGGNSNWDDAKLVFESENEPPTSSNLCGHCTRCEWLKETDEF